jgi:ABC-type sugar transport system permease subunit
MERSIAAPGASPVAAQKSIFKKIAEHWLDYLFIAPFFVSFAIFSLYPLLWAVQLSFSSWRGFGAMRYVGLNNYEAMLKDPYIWQALSNTLIFYMILMPTGILLSILLAVILNNNRLVGRGIFRTIYLLPFVTSTVIVAIVFGQLFDDQIGWINQVLITFGLEPVGWLRNSRWGAVFAVVILTHWSGLGYNVMLFLGGLQGIDPEIYSAAKVDGAGEIAIFWRITLPLLKPVILFLTILATIGLINMFNQVYMLTGGGPQGYTTTLMLRLYQIGFQGGGRYGDAAAFGFLISFIVIVISAVQLRFFGLNRD